MTGGKGVGGMMRMKFLELKRRKRRSPLRETPAGEKRDLVKSSEILRRKLLRMTGSQGLVGMTVSFMRLFLDSLIEILSRYKASGQASHRRGRQNDRDKGVGGMMRMKFLELKR